MTNYLEDKIEQPSAKYLTNFFIVPSILSYNNLLIGQNYYPYGPWFNYYDSQNKDLMKFNGPNSLIYRMRVKGFLICI